MLQLQSSPTTDASRFERAQVPVCLNGCKRVRERGASPQAMSLLVYPRIFVARRWHARPARAARRPTTWSQPEGHTPGRCAEVSTGGDDAELVRNVAVFSRGTHSFQRHSARGHVSYRTLVDTELRENSAVTVSVQLSELGEVRTTGDRWLIIR